jgi:hypothetical protein
MGAAEVAARTVRLARGIDDAARWRFQPAWRRRWEPSVDSIARGSMEPEPLGFLTRERAQLVASRRGDTVAETVAAAERFIAGKVRYFGYPEVELAQPIDYSLDPYSGKAWPSRHSKFIDYRHEEVGDPKWIWELNRCQELPLLAQAWLLSGDERFAEEAAVRLESWTRQQPPGRGIAWSNGFEAGIRGISLALTIDALRAYRGFDDARRRAALLTLHQHASWIRFDPSTHSSANNHRLGELAGLATIGLLAPELTVSDEITTLALGELSAEAGRQIDQDGTGAEQAFAYHLFVVDLLLIVAALLIARSQEIPAGIASALDRSADALWAQMGSDEPAPTYGDADDGRAARLDPFESRDARGVAASLAACRGHSRARLVAGSLDPAALWLFGTDGAAQFDAVSPTPEPPSLVLPDAGLVILRSDDVRAMIDVGPLGYLSLAAHGHADALQITVSDGARALIVDPGAGSYFGHPSWRPCFRGTGFHATVEVDSEDQSEAGGPFLWSAHARTTLLHADPAAGLVLAEHDGYQRLEHPVLHRRAVAVRENVVVVVDRLSAPAGVESHRYRQTWPFHPELTAEFGDQNTVFGHEDGEPRLTVALAASTPAEVALVRGSDDPFGGWSSPRLEEIVPAWHCALTTTSAGSVTDLVAVLRIGDDVENPALEIHSTESGVRVWFNSGARRRELDLDLSGSAAQARWSAAAERGVLA